jgi:3-hydroxy acid dehydrogenase/malonic semialdehyde reductase
LQNGCVGKHRGDKHHRDDPRLESDYPWDACARRGDVVNVGSTSDHFALAHDAAYVASKFAINGLTQALRVDYEGMGMRIIEVAPGVSRTGFAQVRYNGEATRAEEFYERFPAVLEADDVARTIVFALEQPPHVTLGEILMFPSHGRK